MFRGDFRFDPAPGIAVLSDDDRSFYGNSHSLELLVVLGQAVINEDQRRCHVSIDGIRVVAGQLLVLLIAGGINDERWLLQLCREMRGRDHFEQTFFWRGEKYGESFDRGVPAPFLVFRENPLRVFLVVSRSDMVWAGAKPAHVFALVVGAGNGPKLRFPLAFGRGACASETL